MNIVTIVFFFLLVYSITVAIFIRFFAFVRNCDRDLMLMMEKKSLSPRLNGSRKRRKTRRPRVPRLAHA